MCADRPNSSPSASNGGGPWLLALLLWLTGGVINGVGAGWIPSNPQSIHGPHWLLAAAGLALVACRFAPLAARAGPSSWASQIAGLGSIGALTVIANWIAFGIGALMLDAIVVMIIARWLRGNNRLDRDTR